jgi:GxxExxY protein
LDISFKTHRQYGPGLFESFYEIFCYEWKKTEIPSLRQHPILLMHETIKMDAGFRADVILANKIILELKSVETLADVHYKQLLTYLKLTDPKLGLLINFNVVLLMSGVHRIVNNL